MWRHGHIQTQCANTLMKKKAMQSIWSENDSNDSIDEEDLVGGLIVYDNVSKHTNNNEYELNIGGASTSKVLHRAPCKEDTDSHLDTTVQHGNKNNDLDSDISDIDINDNESFS